MEIFHSMINGQLKINNSLLKSCKFVLYNRGAITAEIIPIEPGTDNAV
jgi:hypothetical protein